MSSAVAQKPFALRIPSILLGIFSLWLLYLTVLDPLEFRASKQVLAPPAMIERFAFGYSEVVADTMWIRTIQDLDYCDQQVSSKICKNNSWLYLMIEAITNLSPSFRMPYAAGSLALTVLISDIDGATKIFDKGVKAFPKDWPILYRAAYHYLYEVKDKTRAAELLIQAADNGAPPFARALAGRLYSDAGNIELAENLLQEMIATEQDPILIQRLRDKIQQIKAEK